MRKVKFQVTQQHIDDGEPGNDSSCPVALCIKEWALEETGVDSIQVHVGYQEIQVGFLPTVAAPNSVRNFVQYFDALGRYGVMGVKPFDALGRYGVMGVKPFEFELELDVEVL
jgi:hypothetical protein